MQCDRLVTNMLGTRQCRREGHHEVGGLYLCTQHEREVRTYYERELGVYDLASKVNRLAVRVERSLALRRRHSPGPAVEVQQDADGELWIVGVSDLCTVYFAEMENVTPEHRFHGLIKIGRTFDLAQRMETLGTRALKTVQAPQSFETELHRRFEHLRVTGEWHRPGADLIAYMETL